MVVDTIVVDTLMVVVYLQRDVESLKQEMLDNADRRLKALDRMIKDEQHMTTTTTTGR